MRCAPLLLILLLVVGCMPAQNSAHVRELRDSLTVMVSKGIQNGDTAMLSQALVLSDELLGEENDFRSLHNIYVNRNAIYIALNEDDKAWENTVNGMNCYAQDAPDRLIFTALKKLKDGKPDSADYYLSWAWRRCNELSDSGFDENFAFKKVQILFIQSGPTCAWAYADSLRMAHPESKIMQYVHDYRDRFGMDSVKYSRFINNEIGLIEFLGNPDILP